MGIDVEAKRDIDYLPFVGSVCTRLEQATVANVDDFLTYWTRKEAALKALGVGLATPMLGLTVSPPTAPPRVIDFPEVRQHIQLATISPGPDYVASLAVVTRRPCVVTEHSLKPVS